MSRVAKNPITIPPAVEITLAGSRLDVKGPRGAISCEINALVDFREDGQSICIRAKERTAKSIEQSGTARANIQNMVTGVSSGFERKLVLVGVGYRAQTKGQVLSLSLGYSRPIEFGIPGGVTVETPTQTEIFIRGCDKQLIGQVAANIRSFRGPEPYKGKGVRYSDEVIARKEAKKK